MNPLVSVIIPNHNYGRYLREAVDSVLAQTYPHREILVVDDGSTDESPDILRSYGDRVRGIRQARQGVAAARNRGVANSRGALMAFLDADDRWRPEKLARQVARWCADPSLGLVHCGVHMIDAEGARLGTVCEGVEGWVAQELLLFRRLTYVTGGSGAVVSRESFEEAGGFDARLSTSADWDFYYRIALRRRFAFIPEPLVEMRRHAQNMHANIQAMAHDMLAAYAKAFAQPAPEIRSLRRRAYGNLHMVLAGCFFRAGRPSACAWHLVRSLWLTPANSRRVLGFPLRWWRRARRQEPLWQPG